MGRGVGRIGRLAASNIADVYGGNDLDIKY
jgi:hypothetical protein